jgi:very-short-patch-repair endonuclease
VDPGRLNKAGARLLAEYLEYAGSGGTPVAASGAEAEPGAFEADVVARLAECGITVVPQFGVGGYRVDFAAAHRDDPGRMILAVEADGASYRDSGSVRDRDRLRKEHLERLGWRVHRLWSTSWFQDPEAELARLREAYQAAVRDQPPAPQPPPEEEPSAPAGPPPPEASDAPEAAPSPSAAAVPPDGDGPHPPPARTLERAPGPSRPALARAPGQDLERRDPAVP